MTLTSTKLNNIVTGIHKLFSHYLWLWFLTISAVEILAFSSTSGFHAQTLVAILKVKLKTHFSSCDWLKRRAFLKFTKSWNQNSQAILRSDFLINKVILLFCLKYWGRVPLSQHAVRLIWTALSLPKGYCLDIATIVLCFSFNTKF